MEDYNNDHDKEIIDVVFCSEDGVYIIYIINIIINILLQQVIYVIRKNKPRRGDKYLTKVSNKKDEEYPKNKNVEYDKLKIGNVFITVYYLQSKLYCYYDTIHPPITNITVYPNVNEIGNCGFEIAYNQFRIIKYRMECTSNYPIVEGGIYETEISKQYMKEKKEDEERNHEKKDYKNAVIDVKEEENGGYEKVTHEMEKELYNSL